LHQRGRGRAEDQPPGGGGERRVRGGHHRPAAQPAGRGGAVVSALVRRPRAFSVLEVLIAFLILGLAVLPVLGLFSSTGMEARQTSDYALGIVITEKVAEEMRLAAWEDTHWCDE